MIITKLFTRKDVQIEFITYALISFYLYCMRRHHFSGELLCWYKINSELITAYCGKYWGAKCVIWSHFMPWLFWPSLPVKSLIHTGALTSVSSLHLLAGWVSRWRYTLDALLHNLSVILIHSLALCVLLSFLWTFLWSIFSVVN